MAELLDFDPNGVVWSEEHDRVPLKQRLKLLLASKKFEDFVASKTPVNDVNVKKEDVHFESEVTNSACSILEGMSDRVSSELCRDAGLGECNRMDIDTNTDAGLITVEFAQVDAGIVRTEKVNGASGSSFQHTVLSKYPVKLQFNNTENNSVGSIETLVTRSSNANVEKSAPSTETHKVFLDDLDHIVLKERRRMLLLRKVSGSIKPVAEGNMSGLSITTDDTIQRTVGTGMEGSISGSYDSLSGGSHLHDIPDENASDLLASSPNSTTQCSAVTSHCQGITLTESGNSENMHGHSRLCSYSKNSYAYESNGGKTLISGNQKTGLMSALPTFANVKVEPLDISDLHIPCKETVDTSFDKVLPVKNEVEITEDSQVDIVDHMLLRERMILLASRRVKSPNICGTSYCSRKNASSSSDYNPEVSAKPLRVKHPRKRRKTATDSIETALEEDAPGLLQVLIEKGVLVDEIKLYGEVESDEVLDDSLTEDSFAELEGVISKLFSQRPSLLKFAPIRCAKGERTSYCLACLISLVEQVETALSVIVGKHPSEPDVCEMPTISSMRTGTKHQARYLQFRKWPVEWGWCRDLQSFIFVFERHNRIVLERPEYGYATYFFELVDSLPIHWQIKRLVTAMKLTSCSRVTLIENRALKVGDDLTEGEARVLMEYGWVPDSGLGTMLNYCSRVAHDRKNESDISEWRSKIGKLLVDGINGGTIVPADIPKKAMEHGVLHSSQIKVEL